MNKTGIALGLVLGFALGLGVMNSRTSNQPESGIKSNEIAFVQIIFRSDKVTFIFYRDGTAMYGSDNLYSAYTLKDQQRSILLDAMKNLSSATTGRYKSTSGDITVGVWIGAAQKRFDLESQDNTLPAAPEELKALIKLANSIPW